MQKEILTFLSCTQRKINELYPLLLYIHIRRICCFSANFINAQKYCLQTKVDFWTIQSIIFICSESACIKLFQYFKYSKFILLHHRPPPQNLIYSYLITTLYASVYFHFPPLTNFCYTKTIEYFPWMYTKQKSILQNRTTRLIIWRHFILLGSNSESASKIKLSCYNISLEEKLLLHAYLLYCLLLTLLQNVIPK